MAQTPASKDDRHCAGVLKTAVIIGALSWLAVMQLVVAQESLVPAPSGQGLGQAQRLNASSRQQLDRMHERAGPALDPALERRQQSEQRALQEYQRRDLLWLNRGSGAVNRTPSNRRLQGVHRPRQHQMKQQQQLNRFRQQARPYSNRSR